VEGGGRSLYGDGFNDVDCHSMGVWKLNIESYYWSYSKVQTTSESMNSLPLH
jgi:hypothetical protein